MKKCALLSVYDKTDIIKLAEGLIELGYTILSTGGTYRLLCDHRLDVTEVSQVTQFPEMLDGRVKTLHPNIHAGILFRRNNPHDIEIMTQFNLSEIDLVVNNLYPFEQKLKQQASVAEMIENIDIGGPSMIRAAAKNYHDVLIVTDPADYEHVLKTLKEDSVTLQLRQQLAGKAFGLTAYYDGLIANYFNQLNAITFPNHLTQPLKLSEMLRYGENPHQQAAFYEAGFLPSQHRFVYEQLNGKQISYNNLNDLTGCVKSLLEFDQPCAVGVKHTNPSGIGCGETIDQAYQKMLDCDDVSIFGGIIALNRSCTLTIAESINSMFIEIVIAPDYEPQALAILKQKKNIRVLKCPNLTDVSFQPLRFQDVMNGVLVQEADTCLYDHTAFKVVSKRQPSETEMMDIEFGIRACKHVNSNGVVLVKQQATVGYGFGEVRRSWAVEKALERAGDKADGAILASDGFFFEDTVELLHQAHVKCVVSPGGSIHDQAVIDLCDRYEMALVFTGTRHFKHS